MFMKIADSSLYEMYVTKHQIKQNKGEMRGSKDMERTKCYDAEWRFQRSVQIPQFKSISEAEKFTKKIYKSKLWEKMWKESLENNVGRIFNNYPDVVQMKRSSGRTAGSTNGKTVYLNVNSGLDMYTLLHELAHTLGHMHHGRSFRQALLKLVGQFMGSQFKKVLADSFKQNKLKFGDARKPMSFENWVAARDRMEKIREEKKIGEFAPL